jgi:hypothetical protein
MKITHEIREYVIEDGDTIYSVTRNMVSNDLFYYIIEPPVEGAHVNSISWFDASDELKDRIKQTIKQYNQN